MSVDSCYGQCTWCNAAVWATKEQWFSDLDRVECPHCGHPDGGYDLIHARRHCEWDETGA